MLDHSKAGGLKLGTLWGCVGDEDTALYLYASTGKKRGQREGELGPEDFLEMREGYVVADAAGIYDESFKRADLVECGCNMHSRRYFRRRSAAATAARHCHWRPSRSSTTSRTRSATAPPRRNERSGKRRASRSTTRS